VEYVKRGRIYSEPGVDLQLPESHLAFRLPQDFTGRLRPDGTFKIFSVDRQVSCFVFVHRAGSSLPVNWMSAEFAIDSEKLVATGQLKHVQSDSVYRSFEGDRLLCYKVEKTNRRGAGLHGSAAGFKTEADRLMAFLKPGPAAIRTLVLLAHFAVWFRLDDYIPLSLFRSRRSLCAGRRILCNVCEAKQRWTLGWDRHIALEASSG
jgi:hypothetical protein